MKKTAGTRCFHQIDQKPRNKVITKLQGFVLCLLLSRKTCWQYWTLQLIEIHLTLLVWSFHLLKIQSLRSFWVFHDRTFFDYCHLKKLKVNIISFQWCWMYMDYLVNINKFCVMAFFICWFRFVFSLACSRSRCVKFNMLSPHVIQSQ